MKCAIYKCVWTVYKFVLLDFVTINLLFVLHICLFLKAEIYVHNHDLNERKNCAGKEFLLYKVI